MIVLEHQKRGIMSNNDTLAIKYRPQTIHEIIGQHYVKESLSNGINKNILPRVLLLYGLHGSGKTSAARIIAKSLNCLSSDKPTSEPCGKCSNCISITKENNLDVTEKDMAMDTSVDGIRELNQVCLSSPINSRYRVFILDEVHQLSNTAQNALLRLLEDPPNHCYFILCTTDPQKLIDTLRSRCTCFKFNQIGQEDLISRLKVVADKEGLNYDDSGLYKIYNLSNGSLRDSLSILNELTLLDIKITSSSVEEVKGIIKEGQIIELLDHIINKNISLTLMTINSLLNDGYEAISILEGLIKVLKDLTIIKLTGEYDPSISYTQIKINIERLYDFKKLILIKSINKLLVVLSNGITKIDKCIKKDTMMDVVIIELILSINPD